MADFGLTEIRPDSVPLVNTPYGWYSYNCPPFGLNSPQDVSKSAVYETLCDALKNAYSLRRLS